MNFEENVNKSVSILKEINRICGFDLIYSESIYTILGLILDPIKFIVFGSFSVGKSTFINSFVFEDRIIPAGIGEVTKKTFVFSYSDNSNTFNEKSFEIDELENLIVSASDPKNEVKIHNKKLQKYTVIDIPGYGGLEEDILIDTIANGCDGADAVFFLFDISKGLSGDDIKKSKIFISNFLENGTTQIWTIFNRLDAEEDKEEKQICKLISQTLSSLNLISEEEISYLDTYEKLSNKKSFALSSKKSLDGYCKNVIKNGKEKILPEDDAIDYLNDSRMPFFKEKFSSFLDKIRKETFIYKIDRNIKDINEVIKIYTKELSEKKEEQIKEKQNLNSKIDLKSAELDFILSTKKNIDDSLMELESFLAKLDSSHQRNEIEKLKHKILDIYEDCLIKSISEYKIIGGETKEQLIDKGIFYANKISKPIIEKFVEDLILDFVKNHSVIQKDITIFNEKNENNKLILLDGIHNKSNFSGEHGFSDFTSAMFDGIAMEIASMIASVIAAAIALFFETRLAVLLVPGIGWALGAVSLAYSIWGATTIGDKIASKVKPVLHESLHQGEFPENLTKALNLQLIENQKVKVRDVIDVAKINIQRLSRLSAKNDDERKSIELKIQELLEEKQVSIVNMESKISKINEELNELLSIRNENYS